MNIIVVNIDSVRKDHLGCFGNPWIKTPNLDKFYEKAISFDGMTMNGIPTVPFRRALMLGRKVFPYKDSMSYRGGAPIMGWQPMEHDEVPLQEVLQQSGYITSMVTDVYHFFKPALNFHKGFDSWQLIRGQEGDPLVTGQCDKNASEYMYPHLEGTMMGEFLEQHVRNQSLARSEEDYFAPQVFRTAENWMKKNARYFEKFFLYIDCFDPHEPWDAPQEYVEMYNPGYKGKELIFPQNGYYEGKITEEELTHIKAMYAAEVTMVDRWFGHFMEKFDHMGLAEDTAVLVMTDHGLPLGEHGILKKIPEGLYPELMDIPMMLYVPGVTPANKHVKGLVQECDIAPTLLKLMGIEAPEQMDGLDFWPMVTGEKDSIREYAYGGYHDHAYVRDMRYFYFRSLKDETQRHLFDLEVDPGMNNDIVDENTEMAAKMEGLLIKELDGWTLPKNMRESLAKANYTPPTKIRPDAY